MEKLCFGCMQMKQNSPVCELCGYDERVDNQPHQLAVGTLLQNQYLVGRVLGQGGFGITYIGWDQHLSIPVAIKEYFPSGIVHRHTKISSSVVSAKGSTQEIFARHKDRFLKEARTLAQFSQIPEIVQIKSFFPENDTAYIVMEYVQGITLKDHLKKLGRPMTEEEALSIMEPVLKALQKVHDQKLIHRDISPDNIMLPTGGGVKLIDFGTVRYVDDSGRTQATEAVLKPGFAPMEQYNTKGNLGTWTDVYAICATFHYLLTGKVPADVHERMDEGETLTLLRNKSGLSKKLIDALESGMKIRYAERVQTIGELHRLIYNDIASDSKTPETATRQRHAGKTRKKGLSVILSAGVIAIAAAAMLLTLKAQEEDPEVTVHTSPEAFAAETTIPETFAAETTIPETSLSAEEQLYQEAALLEAAGEYGKSAIAFGKLGSYSDARERSLALWDQVAQRASVCVYSVNVECEGATYAVKDDGSVLFAGGFYGTNSVKALTSDIRANGLGWTDIIAVTDGLRGLRADGTVVRKYAESWDSYEPDCLGWKDIVAISGELGLKLDGTVVMDSDGYYLNEEKQIAISQWRDIIAVCGGWPSVGLTADGRVVTTRDADSVDVSQWQDITAVCVGTGFVVGLKSDGTVVATGSNRSGQCNVSQWTDIVAIAAGAEHTVGLKRDGTVIAVGKNLDGCCNVGSWKNIVAIYAGSYHTVALKNDGTLVAVGSNNFGQCNVSHWTDIKLPVKK